MESSAWRDESWGNCGRWPVTVLTWRAVEACSRYEGRRPEKLGHRRLAAAYGGQSVTMSRRNTDDIELRCLLAGRVRRRGTAVLHLADTCRQGEPACSQSAPPPSTSVVDGGAVQKVVQKYCGTRNTFCRTRGLCNATFSYHVTFIQFKICSCVQNFMKIRWFFTSSSSSSSSCTRVMNHNWSATKQRLHLQSVAEISRHSVLSGTGFDVVWVSPQGHRSVSVSRYFLLQAPRCPCSVRKRFSRDHCCRGRSKPGCRIVGSHTRWELTTWADFQLCLHRLLMSSGCKSSHSGFLDVSRSNVG